jgi:hypothetical protein
MSEEPPYDYTFEMPFHWTTSFNNRDGSPILTIKPTGELVPGPGLSDDEVSKRLANALAGTFETHIKQSVSQTMADEIERLREALRAMLHAVCHETGFAAAVRANSGKAYPWEPLDAAEEQARAALEGK